MARVFVATSAPPGWSLGRWRQVSEILWEEQKFDGSQDVFQFEVIVGVDTPGSSTLRLRLVGKSTEVIVLESTIQVFTEGQYLGEYVGYWEVLEPELPTQTPPEVSSRPEAADMDDVAVQLKSAVPHPAAESVPSQESAPPQEGAPQQEGTAPLGSAPCPPADEAPKDAEEEEEEEEDDEDGDDDEDCEDEEAPQPQKSAPPPTQPRMSAPAVVQPGPQTEPMDDGGALRSMKSAPVLDSTDASPQRVMQRRSNRRSPAATPQKWPPLESPKSPSRKAPFPDASPETTALLTAAATSGDLAALQELLKASADPDAGSALLVAAEGGHVEAVKALIAAGADVNITQDGNTAMTVAYKKGHQEVLRALFGATFKSLETAVVGGGSPTSLRDGILRKLPDSEFDELNKGMAGELHNITERIKELGKVHEPEPQEKVAAYVPTGEVVTIGQLAVKDALEMIVENTRRPATVG